MTPGPCELNGERTAQEEPDTNGATHRHHGELTLGQPCVRVEARGGGTVGRSQALAEKALDTRS